jgi:hypothetical protein
VCKQARLCLVPRVLVNTTMTSIPVDVLRLILEHVDEPNLAKICQLNKICCSCSQDVLYRDIIIYAPREYTLVCRTLAQSTHLARRVRSFRIRNLHYTEGHERELYKSLQNMTCLRSLGLTYFTDQSGDLDVSGFTFKLVSLACDYFDAEPLHRFLQSQPSLTNVKLGFSRQDFSAFGAMFLPNLTGVTASFSWLQQLIPDRPVNEVASLRCALDGESVDLSFFTLSTAPIQKLTIDYSYLYPKPGQLLESIFPSLTYLEISVDYFDQFNQIVCKSPFLFCI